MTDEHPAGPIWLLSAADVKARYRMAGPHLTLRLRVAKPGDKADDRTTRSRVAVAALKRLGADADGLARMETTIDELEPTGQTALVTIAGNGERAARWLGGVTPGEYPEAHIGELPALLPVLDDIGRDRLVLAVLIDRTGAELSIHSRRTASGVEVVEGDTEFVHRGAPGGWSQRRFQQRAEMTWEANAKLVADRVRRHAQANGVEAIVVSGDERAAGFLAAKLPASLRPLVRMVAAGGRHEPTSPIRLHDAATARASELGDEAEQELLDRLAGELGQGGRALVGVGPVGEALAAGTVTTLVTSVVDGHDDLVAKAFGSGAEVVVVERSRLDQVAGPAAEGVVAAVRFQL